jgi:FMN phosphatase YigB (HAD superfamily)
MPRTLIFDLSEVLIAGLLGIEKPLASRLRIAKRAVRPAFTGQLLEELCCGRISEDEYLTRILARKRWRIAPAEVKRIIRENFHRRVPGMQRLIPRLARRYELVLLSDHAAEWAAHIREVHPWLGIFKSQFFSFELKQTIREPSTFQRVLAAIGRRADVCLLIDDSAKNVIAAASIGLPGIRFTSARALARELGAPRTPFRFRTPGRLIDGDLELVLVARQPADTVWRHLPAYEFEMRRTGTATRLGAIRLRIGPARRLRYPGHIGYEVDEQFRGHRYAARSCRLLLPLARAHGLRAVWLTVDPRNIPSQRTCEILGARYVETVRIPEGHEMYRQGARYRRRYRLDLEKTPAARPDALVLRRLGTRRSKG